MTPGEKSKAEKDKENEEMFRKVAEEEAKRAEAEKAAKGKKGWGLTSWFGGGGSKKESLENSPNKPIRAKLGEKSSFVYDPDQKRWVNKAAGAEESAPNSIDDLLGAAMPRKGASAKGKKKGGRYVDVMAK
ncbi:putative copii coat assembly protein sec16 [Diaporthe ampelina]|uniref:Putative copii coat assembly protein sec16 n=1 Tax=Diaporthe ampelina TaxID=1214573 RepID=A0A0G2HXQ0_9PEZI|nr:putative copii coat assembly protein sec16 [Diaporthe ampelina]